MVTEFIVLVLIILLLLFLSMIWPPDSPWAPWWRTNKKVSQAICQLAGITKKDILYDLGCGDGEVLLTAAIEHGARGVGIEIDPLRVFIAGLRVKKNHVSKKVIIKKKSFFDENISSATVVIVYLVPKTLGRLMPKFRKELKKGTTIVSFRYPIKDLKLNKSDKENKLYLYKI